MPMEYIASSIDLFDRNRTNDLIVERILKEDFYVDVKQKGVDMRIGLDAASISSGRFADHIVLIAGDTLMLQRN